MFDIIVAEVKNLKMVRIYQFFDRFIGRRGKPAFQGAAN